MVEACRTNQLDDIYEIFLKISKIKIENITNLSDWQVSDYYEKKMLEKLDIIRLNDFVKYEYTYTLNNKLLKKLRKKLNINEHQDLIITNNNTVSLLMIANLIKQLNCKKVCIIKPMYFSVYEDLKLLNVPYECKSIKFKKNKFILPDIDELKQFDYIWLTSPVFSSSVYYSIDNIAILKTLKQHGKIIIVDEAYSYLTKNLSSNNFFADITVLSPNKVLNINALKFSVIIFNKQFKSIFEHWSDVIQGNLSISNVESINHFLSANYQQCLEFNEKFITNALKEVKNLLIQYPCFKLFKPSHGNMIMIYNPQIDFDIYMKENFFQELMISTNAYILPGVFHDYTDSNGFCFRINLCLYNKKDFIVKLHSVLQYLSKNYM